MTNEIDARFEKFDIFFRELDNSNDRTIAIISVAMIDDLLRELISTVFTKPNKEKALDRYFQQTSKKNELAHNLGLISENVYFAINTVNQVRNKFAHKVEITSFDEIKDIENLMNNLLLLKGNLYREDLKDNTSRVKFKKTIHLICMNLNFFASQLKDNWKGIDNLTEYNMTAFYKSLEKRGFKIT